MKLEPVSTGHVVRHILDEVVEKKLPVGEYARRRGHSPQKVYYHIREGNLTEEKCPCCSSKVIDVKKADDLFHRLRLQKKD